MRRVILCFLLYFCTSGPCYAAPCYGTKMPERNQFFFGTQTHSVVNRYLENNNGKMRSLQHFVLVSFGLFDWLSIDLKGGAGYVKHQPAGEERIDYPAYLGGGYGFRLRLHEYNKIKAVFGFQHISVHPHSINKDGIKNKAVLDDWQFSLLASRDFSIITPYIGTRWSRMDCIHWVDSVRDRKKSDRTKNFGLILGADIPLTDKAWFNVEGNFFDNEAFATSLNFHF